MSNRRRVFIIGFFFFFIYSSAISETLSWKNIYKVRNISRPCWSPDSSKIAFNVNDQGTGTSAIYLCKVDGSALTKLNESEQGFSLIEEPWSKDGRKLFVTKGNSIWEIDANTKKVRKLLMFAGYSKGYIPQVYYGDLPSYGSLAPVLSPDDTKLAFSWQSEIFVLDIENGGYTQITYSHPKGWHNFGPQWSPDGGYILYTSIDTSSQNPFILLTFGKIMGAEKALIGLSEVKVGIVPSSGGETIWMAPKLESKYSLRGGSNVHWCPDGSQILINKISLDHTKREIIVADSKTGKAKIIHKEEVPHWISPLAIWVKYSPDGKKILFTSERTGWNHIYVMDVSGSTQEQITKGDFTVVNRQVYDTSEITPIWSKDGSKIYFPSNEEDTAQKHFYVIPSNGGKWIPLTSMPGVNSHFTLSPDEKNIAFFYSDLYHPQELFVMENAKGANAIQLTDMYLPDDIKKQEWVEKKVVHYRNSKDGTNISALLYLPAKFQKNKKYPAVIFAHGAGYAQNVYEGNWGERFLFNEFLAQRGYVVIGPDFRGSAGYGEKFRLDVFDRMGFIDLDDVISGVDYLKNLGFVDEKRIGIWGHSYGGFMTCMAMFRFPDIFLAGASGAPVTDWERFFYLAPGYNEEHLGFPWENPEGTKKCSPIHYVENLKNHLLILSGMQDTLHLDSEVLVIELLKHQKIFEVIFYPKDYHALSTPTTNEDRWRRIFEFLDFHLKRR